MKYNNCNKKNDSNNKKEDIYTVLFLYFKFTSIYITAVVLLPVEEFCLLQ